MGKKGIKISDLSPRYQKQVLAQINSTDSSSDSQQNTGNVVARKEEIKRHYRPIDRPVSIHYHTKRSRLGDIDGGFLKYFTDALVTSKVLVDDSPEYVEAVSYSQEKSSEEGLVIEIWETG